MQNVIKQYKFASNLSTAIKEYLSTPGAKPQKILDLIGMLPND